VRVLVADDEAPARRRLVRMLGDLGGIEVVGEAADGRAVLGMSERLHPDLVLLDIEMPELEGISVARRLAGSPAVIFVTAHEEHAVSAFAVDAVDYLVKPVRRQRLAEALRRAQARRAGLDEAIRSSAEVTRLEARARLVAHSGAAARIFDARRIGHFWALEKYTAFCADGGEHLSAESLSALEARLAPFGFIRVHRAHLVRRSSIRELRAARGVSQARLDDGRIVPVSRRMLKRLKRQLDL
jgi:DNA-binding LytR/AlgR family response regulator